MARSINVGRIPGQQELVGYGQSQVIYRRRLRYPIHNLALWGGFIVSPDEVVKALKEQGLDITVRTLQRWVKAGLIPEPKRGSFGQGGGTWADYPEETVPEALTAHLLKGVYQLKHSEIAEARGAYREECLAPYSSIWGATMERIEREGYSRVRQTVSPFMINLSKEIAAIIEEYFEDSDKLAIALLTILDFLQSEVSWELKRKYEEGAIPKDMSLGEALKMMARTKPEERLSLLLASLLHLLPKDLGWKLQQKYEEGLIPEGASFAEMLEILEESK